MVTRGAFKSTAMRTNSAAIEPSSMCMTPPSTEPTTNRSQPTRESTTATTAGAGPGARPARPRGARGGERGGGAARAGLLEKDGGRLEQRLQPQRRRLARVRGAAQPRLAPARAPLQPARRRLQRGILAPGDLQ